MGSGEIQQVQGRQKTADSVPRFSIITVPYNRCSVQPMFRETDVPWKPTIVPFADQLSLYIGPDTLGAKADRLPWELMKTVIQVASSCLSRRVLLPGGC